MNTSMGTNDRPGNRTPEFGYFIVLESPIPGLDVTMDGKFLFRAMKQLDESAAQLGVVSLHDFYSCDPEPTKEYFEEIGVDREYFEHLTLQNFAAEEGLATIWPLLEHLRSRPECLANSSELIKDLEDCHRILECAAAHGVRWHLETKWDRPA